TVLDVITGQIIPQGSNLWSACQPESKRKGELHSRTAHLWLPKGCEWLQNVKLALRWATIDGATPLGGCCDAWVVASRHEGWPGSGVACCSSATSDDRAFSGTIGDWL